MFTTYSIHVFIARMGIVLSFLLRTRQQGINFQTWKLQTIVWLHNQCKHNMLHHTTLKIPHRDDHTKH